jgi:predicted RNA-binding protein with PIN domain
MSRAYLIDGYNLMHAEGLLPSRRGPGLLERARERLLELLWEAQDRHPHAVTIVFDAKGASKKAQPESFHHGLHIYFAVGYDQADDLIEALIRNTSAPRQLCVVSDDHRLQTAARRRRCSVLSCAEYLDWLASAAEVRESSASPTDERQAASQEERERWLAEFRNLEKDPTLRELFDDFGGETK